MFIKMIGSSSTARIVRALLSRLPSSLSALVTGAGTDVKIM
ncbi:MAG TPA: hypothetical protein VN047_05235 [Sphingopyxis sp.]|nr:hypothetical protein [Sphingopyxis sp.]